VGFEPTISAGERPQTYALDRAATGTGTEEGIGFLNYLVVKEDLCGSAGSAGIFFT
jgi:hypothetical protein